MKYTIVGCITKYGIEQIRPFVESIEQSGFKGDKLMLVYEITQDTIDYLKNKGWLLIQSEPQGKKKRRQFFFSINYDVKKKHSYEFHFKICLSSQA